MMNILQKIQDRFRPADPGIFCLDVQLLPPASEVMTSFRLERDGIQEILCTDAVRRVADRVRYRKL